MEAPSTNRITAGFILAFVLLVINAAVSFLALSRLNVANQLVVKAERSVSLLGELRSDIIDIENGVRDALIAQDRRLAEAYTSGRPAVLGKIEEAALLARDEPAQRDLLGKLGTAVEQHFRFLDELLASSGSRDKQSLTALMDGSRGKAVLVGIRGNIDTLQQREQVRLSQRAEESQRFAYASMITNFVSTLVSLCLLGGLLITFRRDARERTRSADAEHASNLRLEQGLSEVRQRNEEITFLSQMSSFLQTCNSSDEACAAIARFGPLLFPSESGVIYLFHASRNFVESVSSWGEENSGGASETLFELDDCWALRRGRLHSVTPDSTSMVCAHVQRSVHPSPVYLCAPLMAQGETLGLLFLRPGNRNLRALDDAKHQLATAVAEQIALSLSNIVLRERLRQQSIRDPLTGLHNRRYLEETLDRELARLERRKLPLSLIMIDVDHFKNFNDTFGHEAGDAVLRDLGGVLQRHVRESDVACRYGGEEFTVIMPEADIDIARQRAEILRGAVRELQLVHEGRPLGAVTLSLGVASFPAHGRQREQLLHAADAALYEAKNSGRNHVVVSRAAPISVESNPPRPASSGH